MSKSVILKEQDSKEVIKRVALLVNRLGKLFLIPGWTEENAVILAEWIYDNYKWESLEAVEECLRNPPNVEGKTWRLTPDTIREWMGEQLEKEAIKREREHEKTKQDFKDELPNVDYDSFRKRLAEGKALKDIKPDNPFEDEGYKAFKEQRLKKTILEKGKPT